MDEITRGFAFDNMLGAFISALGLFSIARFGGIPVPNTKAGKFLWYTSMTIQVFEYALVLCSRFMVVLAFLHVRHHHYDCLWKVFGGIPVMDICAFFTAFAVPVISQGLLVMFVYAYVVSTCLKVWNATAEETIRPVTKDMTRDMQEQQFKVFRANLVNTNQRCERQMRVAGSRCACMPCRGSARRSAPLAAAPPPLPHRHADAQSAIPPCDRAHRIDSRLASLHRAQLHVLLPPRHRRLRCVSLLLAGGAGPLLHNPGHLCLRALA